MSPRPELVLSDTMCSELRLQEARMPEIEGLWSSRSEPGQEIEMTDMTSSELKKPELEMGNMLSSMLELELTGGLHTAHAWPG
jgi:hypothetical protein